MSLVNGVTNAYTLASSSELPVRPIRPNRKVSGEERAVRPAQDEAQKSQKSFDDALRSQLEQLKNTDTTGLQLSKESSSYLKSLADSVEPETKSKNPLQGLAQGYTARGMALSFSGTGTLASIPDQAPTVTSAPTASEETTEESSTPDLAEDIQLSPEEEEVVDQLQARDMEVRTHEQAHIAASGGLAKGGANFSFTTGPDGRQYATGGSVSIDTSIDSSDPQQLLSKARQIRSAALAPASPSSQDQAVAAQAAAMEAEAQQKNTQKTQDNENGTSGLIGETEEEDDTSLIVENSDDKTEEAKDNTSSLTPSDQVNGNTQFALAGLQANQNTLASQANAITSSNEKSQNGAQQTQTSAQTAAQGFAQVQTSNAVQALTTMSQLSQSPNREQNSQQNSQSRAFSNASQAYQRNMSMGQRASEGTSNSLSYKV